LWSIGFDEGTLRCGFTVDLYRAHEYHAPDAGPECFVRQTFGASHIDTPVLRKWIGNGIAKDMRPGGEMDDTSHALQRIRPPRAAIHIPDGDVVRLRCHAHRAPDAVSGFRQGAT
jgi:hypothetical protein